MIWIATSHRTGTTLVKTLTIVCILAFMAAVAPCSAATDMSGIKERILVRANDEQFNPETQEFTATGNARIEYGQLIITADEVSGNASTGEMSASGHVQFQDPERKLTGDTFKYNSKTGIGLATNARGTADKVYFRGAQMTAEPGKYDLKGAMFTTCDQEKPHYYLAAKELILEPNNMLIARGVRVVLFGKTLFYLPTYRTPVGNGAARGGTKLPTVGTGDHSGIFAGYQFDLGRQPDVSGLLDVRISTKWFLQGGVKYEHLAGGPVFVRATYREPSYGGSQPFSVVTRIPEVGIRFGPKNMVDRYSSSKEAMILSRGLIEPMKTEASNAKVNFIGEMGIGRFAEEPDLNQAWRFDARATSWLKPIKIGKNTLFSPAVYGRVSRYQSGDTYTDLGLKLAAARRLSDRSFVSLAYIAHTVRGITPFDFDAVDLRDELAARVGFPIGEFNMEIMERYDLNTHDIFDTEVSLSRPIHCLEPKITWKKRFKEFTFGLGIIGF